MTTALTPGGPGPNQQPTEPLDPRSEALYGPSYVPTPPAPGARIEDVLYPAHHDMWSALEPLQDQLSDVFGFSTAQKQQFNRAGVEMRRTGLPTQDVKRMLEAYVSDSAAAIRGARELSSRHIADAIIAAATRDAGCRVLMTTDEAFATELVAVEQLRS